MFSGSNLKIIEEAINGGQVFLGGMDLRHIVLTLIAVFVIMGIVAVGSADKNITVYRSEERIILNFDQKVDGTGFFSSYKYSLMPDALGPALFNGVETKSKAHGSGRVDADLQMHLESYYTYENYTNPEYKEEREKYEDEDFEDSDSIVKLKDDSNMSYNPISMAIGSKYYSLHPVIFNSLLNENAWIKNRDNLNSMIYAAEGAHKLSRRMLDIDANYEVTTMNVAVENLVEGKAHFGVLWLPKIPEDKEGTSGLAMKAWKKPLTEIDEDYVGTFNISKKMTIRVKLPLEKEKEEEWLPCCSSYGGRGGGWYGMYPGDRKGFGASTNGIFDCTCFKVPNKAQFAE